jgi:OHCU decarboxylase
MRLDDLNALDASAATRDLLRCCGSLRWAARMTGARPFGSVAAMMTAADEAFASLDRADWLEAFAAHPKIGATGGEYGPARADRAGRIRGAAGEDPAPWSEQEQARVADAAGDVRDRLAQRNREYESRFGYIFIVCATGRSAGDMLEDLDHRLTNEPETELGIAAGEQRKIARLRLMKLLDTP